MTDRQVTQLTAKHDRQVASLKAALVNAKNNAEIATRILSGPTIGKKELRSVSAAINKVVKTTTKHSA
jgi:hypothetical protein